MKDSDLQARKKPIRFRYIEEFSKIIDLDKKERDLLLEEQEHSTIPQLGTGSLWKKSNLIRFTSEGGSKHLPWREVMGEKEGCGVRTRFY